MLAKTSDVNKIYTLFFYCFIFTDQLMLKLGYKLDAMIYNLDFYCAQRKRASQIVTTYVTRLDKNIGRYFIRAH